VPKVNFFLGRCLGGCIRVKRSDWVRSGDDLGAKTGERGLEKARKRYCEGGSGGGARKTDFEKKRRFGRRLFHCIQF
jgi:hypothetical protein